jgi:predicted MFS family arabinose efflux permease
LRAEITSFARILSSETLNTTSSSILLISTPLIAITTLNADSIEVGYLAAAGTAAPLLFGLSAGAIADRFDRGKVLFWCGVVRLLLVATLLFIFFVDGVSVVFLCFVSFGLSVVKLLFDSVMAAVIPTIVRRDGLAKANSWYEAINSTAYTLGPAIAGWLLQSVSVAAVYAINSVLYLASTVFLKGIALPYVPHSTSENRSHIADIADGVEILWKNEIQRTIALAAGLFNLFHTAFFTVFTIFALKELDFSAASFGTVVSLVGLAGLFGALCAPKLIEVLGARMALVGSLLIIGPLGIPIIFSENLPFLHRAALIAGCLAAWDFMIVVHVIVEQTIRQVLVNNAHLSRITATTRFVSWGVDPIGALLGGLAASSAIGSRGTLLICLLGFAASGAYLLTSRGIRSLNDVELGFRPERAVSE